MNGVVLSSVSGCPVRSDVLYDSAVALTLVVVRTVVTVNPGYRKFFHSTPP